MAYYHVKAELKNKELLYDLDNTRRNLIRHIIEPYKQSKEFHLGGTPTHRSKIDKITVYSTNESMKSKVPDYNT
jgi:hypothetical protein